MRVITLVFNLFKIAGSKKINWEPSKFEVQCSLSSWINWQTGRKESQNRSFAKLYSPESQLEGRSRYCWPRVSSEFYLVELQWRDHLMRLKIWTAYHAAFPCRTVRRQNENNLEMWKLFEPKKIPVILKIKIRRTLWIVLRTSSPSPILERSLLTQDAASSTGCWGSLKDREPNSSSLWSASGTG